jgi:hypothetical protein
MGTEFWWKFQKKRHHQEDIDVDGGTNHKIGLREIEWGGLDWIYLTQDRAGGRLL